MFSCDVYDDFPPFSEKLNLNTYLQDFIIYSTNNNLFLMGDGVVSTS